MKQMTFLLVLIALAIVPVSAKGMKSMTGKVLNRSDVSRELPVAQMGDNAYAQVNSEWLRSFYKDYRNELCRMGIVKWDTRFNCRHFASVYAELAQSKFFSENFQSDTTAKALALGPVWYQKDNNKGGHAIIMALTEKGRIFIEPQTGEEVQLSPAEKASIFFAMI